jgi:hypothetical protein
MVARVYHTPAFLSDEQSPDRDVQNQCFPLERVIDPYTTTTNRE